MVEVIMRIKTFYLCSFLVFTALFSHVYARESFYNIPELPSVEVNLKALDSLRPKQDLAIEKPIIIEDKVKKIPEKKQSKGRKKAKTKPKDNAKKIKKDEIVKAPAKPVAEKKIEKIEAKPQIKMPEIPSTPSSAPMVQPKIPAPEVKIPSVPNNITKEPVISAPKPISEDPKPTPTPATVPQAPVKIEKKAEKKESGGFFDNIFGSGDKKEAPKPQKPNAQPAIPPTLPTVQGKDNITPTLPVPNTPSTGTNNSEKSSELPKIDLPSIEKTSPKADFKPQSELPTLPKISIEKAGNLKPAPQVPSELLPVPITPDKSVNKPEVKGQELASIPPAKTTSKILGQIDFAKDVIELTPEQNKKLDEIVSMLKQNRDERLNIIAYASNPEDKNSSARRISLKRAVAVRQYIADAGIDVSRINVQAMGNADGKKLVDRVEIQPASSKS